MQGSHASNTRSWQLHELLTAIPMRSAQLHARCMLHVKHGGRGSMHASFRRTHAQPTQQLQQDGLHSFPPCMHDACSTDRDRPLKVVLVATKTDLPLARHQIRVEAAQDYAAQSNMDFFDVSSVSGPPSSPPPPPHRRPRIQRPPRRQLIGPPRQFRAPSHRHAPLRCFQRLSLPWPCPHDMTVPPSASACRYNPARTWRRRSWPSPPPTTNCTRTGGRCAVRAGQRKGAGDRPHMGKSDWLHSRCVSGRSIRLRRAC